MENRTTDVVDEQQLTRQLRDLVERGDWEALNQEVEHLPNEVRSRVLSRLGEETQKRILESLDPERAADFVRLLPEVQAVDLLEEIAPEHAADILEELPQDEQADFVGEMEARIADAVLAEIDDAADRETIRKLAEYEDDEAGGVMVTEYLSLKADMTVAQVVDYMRRSADELAELDVQYAYVVDDRGKLVGVLRLRDLLLSPGSRKLADIMIPNPIRVLDRTSIEELHEIFEKHSFIGIPVVDDQGKLLGIARRGDVEEALADRAADDYLKTQGILSEELRTMPVTLRSRRRLAWLSINIVLNVIAASVIAAYQETLSQVIALAVFLPIISDMSGCSGNQAVAVSMRELSMGLVDAREVFRVWIKEVSVGLINGFVLGLLIAVVAVIWQGNPWLGGVVGAALMLNTIIAVSLGGTLPLVMRLVGMDPALASGPILTTVTDMCGFFLVLSLATLALDKLV